MQAPTDIALQPAVLQVEALRFSLDPMRQVVPANGLPTNELRCSVMRGHVGRRSSTWGYVIDVAADPATGKRRQRTKSGVATKASSRSSASVA